MKKKTIALLLLLLFSALCLTTACKSKDEYAPPAGMQIASDEKANFYLYVPDDWTVDYMTAAAGTYYSASDPSSVSVMAWDLPYTDSTLDDWWAINEPEVKNIFPDYELVSEENAEIDGLYAKKYIYTGSVGENAFRFMQTACIKKSTVYLFTYTSTEELFDSHLAEVETILGYLRIK